MKKTWWKKDCGCRCACDVWKTAALILAAAIVLLIWAKPWIAVGHEKELRFPAPAVST